MNSDEQILEEYKAEFARLLTEGHDRAGARRKIEKEHSAWIPAVSRVLQNWGVA